MAAKPSSATDPSEGRPASRRQRRLLPHSTAPAIRDFAADWKRWSVPERIIAMAMLVLLVLVVSVAAALISH
jgi:hypothetical protein